MPIIRYDNLQLKNGEIIKSDWGRSGLVGSSPLHSIASYLAMFAPAMPEYFIKRYSKSGDLVMDPFSGRGTTALRARETNRRFIGSDLNPYALVISRFKTSTIQKTDIMNRINDLQKLFIKWKENNMNIYKRAEYKELNIYYSPSMLRSLIFLRTTLGSDWRNINETDNAILAFALGIMHGPSRKDGSSIYFSLSMSNSISMAPNYVKKYAAQNKLKKPRGTFFQPLINRINKKFDIIIESNFDGKVIEFDATSKNNYIKDESVDLIVTSPPYLSIVNYTNSNWIKLWLLGYNRKELKNDIRLSDKLKYKQYVPFITSVLNGLHSKIKTGGHICLIVGDVKSKRLIESVWDNIKDCVEFEFVEIFYDNNYKQNKKVLNTMNNRKGKATTIEKVLVLRKV